MAELTELDRMERDVEEARARLAGDLARLRDPETLAAAKEQMRAQAGAYKEEAIGRTRQTAAAAGQTFLEQARLRAEHSPIAALALGAGIAWKLWRNPPIGGLLIAAGLAGLLNAKVDDGSATPTTDALFSARDSAREKARRASASVQDASRKIGDQIREGARDASAQAASLAAQTAAQIADGAAEARAQASEASARLADYAERTNQFAREQFKENPLYFGAAALAVGAALSLATRSRGPSRDD